MSYYKTEDGCRLYYEFSGLNPAGPVIVFLSGTIQSTVHWTLQVRYFRERYRILLYDARAQGRSDPGRRSLSLDVHATDLSALMHHLDVMQANLVGVSHGARVALELTTRHHHLVDRLALCGIAAVPSIRSHATLKLWRDILSNRGIEAVVWTMLPSLLGRNYLAENRKVLPKIVRAIISRNRPDSLLAHLDAMLAYPPPPKPKVSSTLPVLVISGEQDALVSPGGAGQLADWMGAKHVVFGGVGHTVQFEAPDRFNQELDSFLSTP